MQYYENIPSLIPEVIRSLYSQSVVDVHSYTFARLSALLNATDVTASITLVLSQVGLVVSVLCIACIVFIVIQRRALKSQNEEDTAVASMPTNSPLPAPAGALRNRWNVIVAHLESTHENEWKVAVMEADKLVDDALAKAGFSGATFGDRLSNIQPGTLLSLDGVWWAHKVRNRLAHEIDYFLRYTEARQAVGYYEAVLSELQLI